MKNLYFPLFFLALLVLSYTHASLLNFPSDNKDLFNENSWSSNKENSLSSNKENYLSSNKENSLNSNKENPLNSNKENPSNSRHGANSPIPIQCVDEHNNPVDWAIFYKLPRVHGTDNLLVANGEAYLYVTSEDVRRYEQRKTAGSESVKNKQRKTTGSESVGKNNQEKTGSSQRVGIKDELSQPRRSQSVEVSDEQNQRNTGRSESVNVGNKNDQITENQMDQNDEALIERLANFEAAIRNNKHHSKKKTHKGKKTAKKHSEHLGKKHGKSLSEKNHHKKHHTLKEVNTLKELDTVTNAMNTLKELNTATNSMNTLKELNTATKSMNTLKELDTTTNSMNTFKDLDTATNSMNTLKELETATNSMNTLKELETATNSGPLQTYGNNKQFENTINTLDNENKAHNAAEHFHLNTPYKHPVKPDPKIWFEPFIAKALQDKVEDSTEVKDVEELLENRIGTRKYRRDLEHLNEKVHRKLVDDLVESRIGTIKYRRDLGNLNEKVHRKLVDELVENRIGGTKLVDELVENRIGGTKLVDELVENRIGGTGSLRRDMGETSHTELATEETGDVSLPKNLEDVLSSNGDPEENFTHEDLITRKYESSPRVYLGLNVNQLVERIRAIELLNGDSSIGDGVVGMMDGPKADDQVAQGLGDDDEDVQRFGEDVPKSNGNLQGVDEHGGNIWQSNQKIQDGVLEGRGRADIQVGKSNEQPHDVVFEGYGDEGFPKSNEVDTQFVSVDGTPDGAADDLERYKYFEDIDEHQGDIGAHKYEYIGATNVEDLDKIRSGSGRGVIAGQVDRGTSVENGGSSANWDSKDVDDRTTSVENGGSSANLDSEDVDGFESKEVSHEKILSDLLKQEEEDEKDRLRDEKYMFEDNEGEQLDVKENEERLPSNPARDDYFSAKLTPLRGDEAEPLANGESQDAASKCPSSTLDGSSQPNSESTLQWTLSEHSVRDRSSLPGRILSPYLFNDSFVPEFTQDGIKILYNDQTPGNKTTVKFGHSKGLVLGNADGGIWIVHSIPHFVDDTASVYSYPHTGLMYGQNFLCLSLNASELDRVGNNLGTNQAWAYSTYASESARALYPTLSRVINGTFTPPPNNVFQSRVHTRFSAVPFETFAKTREFGLDLYSRLIAAELNVNLLVETWPNGPGRLRTDCAHPNNKVENIESLKAGQVVGFKSTHDHAKWAISFGNETASRNRGSWRKLGTDFDDASYERVWNGGNELGVAGTTGHDGNSGIETHWRNTGNEIRYTVDNSRNEFFGNGGNALRISEHDGNTGNGPVVVDVRNKGNENWNTGNGPFVDLRNKGNEKASEVEVVFNSLDGSFDTVFKQTRDLVPHREEIVGGGKNMKGSIENLANQEFELVGGENLANPLVDLVGGARNFNSELAAGVGRELVDSVKSEVTGGEYFVCNGDINRAEDQLKRGGGSVCLNNEAVWGLYQSLISGVEPCPAA